MKILDSVVSSIITMQDCITKISGMLKNFYNTNPYWKDYFNDAYMKKAAIAKPGIKGIKGQIQAKDIENYAEKILKENKMLEP